MSERAMVMVGGWLVLVMAAVVYGSVWLIAVGR